jgi:hypothetical protein
MRLTASDALPEIRINHEASSEGVMEDTARVISTLGSYDCGEVLHPMCNTRSAVQKSEP